MIFSYVFVILCRLRINLLPTAPGCLSSSHSVGHRRCDEKTIEIPQPATEAFGANNCRFLQRTVISVQLHFMFVFFFMNDTIRCDFGPLPIFLTILLVSVDVS